MISKKLLEHALAMMHIASDDATRYHITGVYIVVSENVSPHAYPTVTLVATDGHRLIERVFTDMKCPLGKFMLFRDKAKFLKLVLKDSKYMEELNCDIDSNGGLLIGSLGVKVHIDKYESEYPDYKNVIPKHLYETSISFNAEYLFEMMQALNWDRKKAKGVTITFDPLNPISPMLVSSGAEGNNTAVLMPMRDKTVIDKASRLSELLKKEDEKVG